MSVDEGIANLIVISELEGNVMLCVQNGEDILIPVTSVVYNKDFNKAVLKVDSALLITTGFNSISRHGISTS
jgi:hypothetical protein